MNREQQKNIFEAVGMVAIVASLVFLSLEIRQSNVQARAAAYQAIGIATATAFDSLAHDRQFLILAQKAAEAMDKAFLKEWRTVKGTALSSLGEEDRRILLVAIAQGVVAHLQQHPEAIRVEVNFTNTQGEGRAVEINTEGLMGILSS